MLVAALLLTACTVSGPEPAQRVAASRGAEGSLASSASAGALPPNAFQILHTNDIHGHLAATTEVAGVSAVDVGGMALLGGLVAKERALAPGRTLTLDAGDAWTGTLVSAIDRGAAVVEAMDIIGYQAMAIGNHDLDWGQDELAKRAEGASFPFLAANLVDERTGRTPAFAKPYVILDAGAAKVGVIGLTNPDTGIIKATSTRGLRFLPGTDAIRRYLVEVRRRADVVVVLSHLGLEGGTRRYLGGDTALAEAVPGIDLIVGGHDHLVFDPARTVAGVKIFQAGSYARDLGRIVVTVDPASKRVVSVRGTDVVLTVSSDHASPLPAVASLVAQSQAAADKYGRRVVGTATATFPQERDMNGPLGGLVADALLEYGRAQGWHSDLAFYNGAGIRAPLPAGDVTYAALAEVLPFQNTVVSVDLTGQEVRLVLEGMAGSAGRLFMSGGTMAYRYAAPAGRRVVRAEVGARPLDPARVYHVATIDYLLGGGDGHAVFTAGTNVIYGDVDLDVVSAYLRAHSPVTPVPGTRVTSE